MANGDCPLKESRKFTDTGRILAVDGVYCHRAIPVSFTRRRVLGVENGKIELIYLSIRTGPYRARRAGTPGSGFYGTKGFRAA